MIQNGVGKTVSSAKNALRRHRGDFLIILFMSVLMLLGLVVIYSISPALTAKINAAGNELDQNHFMYRQVIYLLAGIAAFVVASVIPLQLWQRHQGKLLLAALALCLVPIVFASTDIALCANGACRWIDLGFASVQPAEFLKFALLLFVAGFLARRIQQDKLNNLHETLIPLGLVLGVAAVIIIGLQRDLGTGIAMFGIVTSMLFVGGLRTKLLLFAMGGILAMGALFTITAPHRLERISTFLSGAADDADTGYHVNQALIAVGSGGVTGKGLGRSIQAFGYLPEAANDSIFAIVAEKFGFVGTVAILLIFAALFRRLLKIIDTAATIYHKLIVAGVFGWVFTHTTVNIGAMLGIFPLTGVTLPFLSFGGTSLLFIMMALGITLQISRYTIHQRLSDIQQGGSPHEDRRGRRGFGRPRYAGISRR